MSDTTVSVLTPPGKSALAVLALRGPQAWEGARAIFLPRRGELPETPLVGRYWLGQIGDETRDDAVLAVRDAQSIELHAHGGREVVRWLTDLLVARGLRTVPWTEALSSPLEAITAATLAETTTLRTAAIALDQHGGVLRRALEALRDESDAATFEAQRQALLRWARLGEHLAKAWRVVIAGVPNVGKSSLLNALAGFQRSIVAPTPGTTRDVVTASLAIDGWPVEVSDTAGQRQGGETLESQGIALAAEAMLDADLCLWLLDATSEPVFPVSMRDNVRIVVNKIDQSPTWDLARAGDALRVSATTGEGLDRLCTAISAWLVPEVPAAGTPVPVGAVGAALAHEEARRMIGEFLG